MQPNQPTPTNNQNPYEFIFNEQQTPKTSSLGGGSLKNRILLVAGGGIVLIIILIILSSFLGGSDNSTQLLTSLAQEQTEIIRVATIGTTKSIDSKARNLAQTTVSSISSSQQQTLDILLKRNVKLGIKQLALKMDSKTDKQLESASLNNSFDATFILVMQTQLKTYQANVKKAFDSTSSKSQKKLLTDSYNGVNILLEMQ